MKKCPYCPRKFKDHRGISAHLKWKHTGETLDMGETPGIPEAKEAKTDPELQYSFYNSPKELRLDLGQYIIRIEKK